MPILRIESKIGTNEAFAYFDIAIIHTLIYRLSR